MTKCAVNTCKNDREQPARDRPIASFPLITHGSVGVGMGETRGMTSPGVSGVIGASGGVSGVAKGEMKTGSVFDGYLDAPVP